jgi:hypothetical protein
MLQTLFHAGSMLVLLLLPPCSLAGTSQTASAIATASLDLDI